MKNFTKAALIIVLILVILGSILCAVGMGIGFTFADFWEQVDAGEFSIGPVKRIPFIRYRNNDFDWDEGSMSWSSKEDVDFNFPWEDVRKIEMDVDYSGVKIVESAGTDHENINLRVEYRKENHKYQVRAYLSGDTLKIEGKNNGIGYNWKNDSARMTLELPRELMEDGWLEEISLEQGRGYINVEMPLTAKEIRISVGAGECEISEKLTAQKEMTVEVDAGTISLEELETEELEISGGVGELTADLIQAEKIDIGGGVGNIEVTVVGKETDYNYDIQCGVGSVEVGDSDYSGLGTRKSIGNPGNKEIKIECGVGNVDVSFEDE